MKEENLSAKLWVNKKSVDLNPFVEEFLARIAIGSVTPLRGVEYVRSVEIHHERGDVEVNVNGEEISVTPFPNEVIANTLLGLVSTLKGVDKVDNFDISVKTR